VKHGGCIHAVLGCLNYTIFSNFIDNKIRVSKIPALFSETQYFPRSQLKNIGFLIQDGIPREGDPELIQTAGRKSLIPVMFFVLPYPFARTIKPALNQTGFIVHCLFICWQFHCSIWNCQQTLRVMPYGMGPVGRSQTYAPRLRVQTDKVVLPRSIDKLQIITFGKPLWKRYHVGGFAVMSLV